MFVPNIIKVDIFLKQLLTKLVYQGRFLSVEFRNKQKDRQISK